jgi:hypothetical protein
VALDPSGTVTEATSVSMPAAETVTSLVVAHGRAPGALL